MSQVKIEIASTDVRTIKGTRKSDGQAYEMRKQEAFLHGQHHYPDRFEITLGRDKDGNPREPYAPGFYDLGPGSIAVNREYANLEISPFEMTLVPLEPVQAPKAVATAKVG